MSTFQKLCKCDNVLLWLGESRFAEVKPLQNTKGVGPLQEWQLASECVNHIHEKNLSAKRPRKPISKRSTDIAPTISPRGTKRKRSDIDYKQYHTAGTLSVRSPPPAGREKPLPRASGPSESRLASQEHIRRSNSKQSILGTTTDIVKKEIVPRSRITRISHKLVKEEPNIRLVHRKERLMGPVRVIHASGKLCKSSNKGGYYDDELPDLPSVPELPPVSVDTSDSRDVQTLHSPPITRSTKQLVLDVLSGYRIDNTTQMRVPVTPAQSTSQSRVVQTPRVVQTSQTVSDVLSGYVPKVPAELPIPLMRPPVVSRVVATPETGLKPVATESTLKDMVTTEIECNVELPQTESQSVPTSQLSDYNESRIVTTDDDFEQAERTAAAERKTELHLLLLGDDQDDSRPVATDPVQNERPQVDIEAAETLLQLRDTDTSQDEEAINETPKHTDMATDAPAAIPVEDQEHYNQELDENEVLMPVDAPMQQDFVKEMAEAEKTANPEENMANDDDDDDDAETIIYETDTPTVTPRKGTVTFKHYGIRRHSPRLANTRKHRCPLCSKSVNSKKELNDHHRAEHEGVKCPTCNKIFPTADTYQRHRYVHHAPANYKCEICEKILPFKSDLTRHLKTHTEEKKWLCAHPTCGKDFKRKADLDLHAVVHSGVIHRCTEPGCSFNSLDPRNVKRHKKKHTQEATVSCTECDEKFVFYMQMKRHRDQEH